MNELTTESWYEELVEECKTIITEAVFTSRWALVEGYWGLGKRIREDKLAQERQQDFRARPCTELERCRRIYP